MTRTGVIRDFFKGDDKTFTLDIKDSAGVAIDITSYVITYYMKNNESDTDGEAVFTKIADVATQGAAGRAIFDITDEESDAFDTKRYFNRIKIVTAAGKKYTAYNGMTKIKI